MIKTMTAKFNGRCSRTGAPIRAGELIEYNTRTRTASKTRFLEASSYVSYIYEIDGREFYRNKAGRCIDAPCCGCCTI